VRTPRSRLPTRNTDEHRKSANPPSAGVRERYELVYRRVDWCSTHQSTRLYTRSRGSRTAADLATTLATIASNMTPLRGVMSRQRYRSVVAPTVGAAHERTRLYGRGSPYRAPTARTARSLVLQHALPAPRDDSVLARATEAPGRPARFGVLVARSAICSTHGAVGQRAQARIEPLVHGPTVNESSDTRLRSSTRPRAAA